MTTMSISLPDDMLSFIQEQMTQVGYASASEYLHDLIRAAQRQNARRQLEAKLAEGLKGPTTKMTREDWDIIEREAMEGIERLG
jgi:antitoxin ParD1/3/4